MPCVSVFDNPVGPNGGCIFANPNVWLDIPTVELPSEGGGRGTGGIHRPRTGYEQGRDDAVEETRRKRILQEDDDIVALIASMLENRLM
jgi:hypothetical protein